MKKLYYLGVIALIGFGVWIIFSVGHKPTAKVLMEASSFAEANQIGAAAYEKLKPELGDQKIVVLGIPPRPSWNYDIARGFLEAANQDQKPFEALIAETDMEDLNLVGLPPVELIKIRTNTETQAEFGDALQKVKQEGKRTLVYVPSIFSSRLLAMNPVNRLEKQTGDHFPTITATPLSLRPDQEFLVDPPCVGSERDMGGTSDLGCAVLLAGRGLYKKNLPQDKYVAFLNSPVAGDYVLMVSFPNQGELSKEGNYNLRMNPPGPTNRMRTGVQ